MNYSFDIEIATKIGVDEAIMLNNFVFWLSKNKANNKNFFDGNFWTYNSVRAYTELFPFWTESKIKRILKSLIEQNVLIVGNYNSNSYDRTNWYALSIDYIYLIDWTISTNGKDGNDQPIPYINTDIKTNITLKEKKYDEDYSNEFIEIYNWYKDNTVKPIGDKKKAYSNYLKQIKKISYIDLKRAIYNYVMECKENKIFTKHLVSLLNSDLEEYAKMQIKKTTPIKKESGLI